MATKRLIDAKADNCDETAKIKTHHARIVVDGTAEKPYYSIEWYDPLKKEYYLGYSSYFIANVFNWLAECFEIVDEQPTVDVVEVVHGRWISQKYSDPEGEYYLNHCSVCCVPNARKRNYCPDCGAKMDGERKDNED